MMQMECRDDGEDEETMTRMSMFVNALLDPTQVTVLEASSDALLIGSALVGTEAKIRAVVSAAVRLKRAFHEPHAAIQGGVRLRMLVDMGPMIGAISGSSRGLVFGYHGSSILHAQRALTLLDFGVAVVSERCVSCVPDVCAYDFGLSERKAITLRYRGFPRRHFRGITSNISAAEQK